MKITPYIFFNGNCEEALKFYHSVLGGKIDILRYADMPAEVDFPISGEWKEKVMHGSLTFDDGFAIYFSDSWEDAPVDKGNNSNIHVNVESEERVYEIFEKLSVGGEISMPAEETFWGSVYGSFQDKYGVCWGIEFEIKEN